MADAEVMPGTSDLPQIPSTPPPGRTRSAQSNGKIAPSSPHALSSSMTPPPSAQPPRPHTPILDLNQAATNPLLASPPDTVKPNASNGLPTAEVIASANIDDLRSIIKELTNSVKEARMSAAHFKLQYNLLIMESQEAAQRAEVEQQMMRREIEVLQAAEQRHRNRISSTPQAPVNAPQPQIDALTKTCQALEQERDDAEAELDQARRATELEKDRADLLMDQVLLLKKRIRENREHYTRIKSSPMYSTPRDAFTTPIGRSVPRYGDSSTNSQGLAALLAADELINGESVTVPSTPSKSRSNKVKQGHTRGAHSLSSLLTTPARTRPATADGYPEPPLPFSAPGSQLVNESAERERHDRDSTISVSDIEGGSDDVQQSQASSLATNMLRRNPGSQESQRHSQSAERSSNLLQTKLLGKVTKSGQGQSPVKKRQRSLSEAGVKAKKAKLHEGVGLGIESWSQR